MLLCGRLTIPHTSCHTSTCADPGCCCDQTRVLRPKTLGQRRCLELGMEEFHEEGVGPAIYQLDGVACPRINTVGAEWVKDVGYELWWAGLTVDPAELAMN